MYANSIEDEAKDVTQYAPGCAELINGLCDLKTFLNATEPLSPLNPLEECSRLKGNNLLLFR